ncbi:hypothetical protein HPB48_007941 [Haemaphysalis longicornis]|uniref:Uncharacterized protein n=1 Tax=Haemaphysalis longicornis TaxID=44386 RepID=A0A9J6FLY5_HAELO|nr:hypothetical protein HPB48_007941 [Haemaphysalis longicornis]
MCLARACCEQIPRARLQEDFQAAEGLTFYCLSSRFSVSAYSLSTVLGCQQLPAQKTRLIALVYIGSQVSMYGIGDKFDVTEFSVYSCVTWVIRFLHVLSVEVISCPNSVEEVTRIKAGFLAKSGGKDPGMPFGASTGHTLKYQR